MLWRDLQLSRRLNAVCTQAFSGKQEDIKGLNQEVKTQDKTAGRPRKVKKDRSDYKAIRGKWILDATKNKYISVINSGASQADIFNMWTSLGTLIKFQLIVSIQQG